MDGCRRWHYEILAGSDAPHERCIAASSSALRSFAVERPPIEPAERAIVLDDGNLDRLVGGVGCAPAFPKIE